MIEFEFYILRTQDDHNWPYLTYRLVQMELWTKTMSGADQSQVPRIRQLTLSNINSYASGRQPAQHRQDFVKNWLHQLLPTCGEFFVERRSWIHSTQLKFNFFLVWCVFIYGLKSIWPLSLFNEQKTTSLFCLGVVLSSEDLSKSSPSDHLLELAGATHQTKRGGVGSGAIVVAFFCANFEVLFCFQKKTAKK